MLCNFFLAQAVPEVTDVAPSVVRVDGHRGFQPAAHEAGLPLLIEKARKTVRKFSLFLYISF